MDSGQKQHYFLGDRQLTDGKKKETGPIPQKGHKKFLHSRDVFRRLNAA